MSNVNNFILLHTDDWQQVVDKLLPELTDYDVILISGPLGSGKTTFIQQLFAQLGVDKPVMSPTFGLLHEYEFIIQKDKSPKKCLHADLYRLKSDDQNFVSQLVEAAAEAELTAIEWPEKLNVDVYFPQAWRIMIKLEDGRRLVQLTSPGTDKV